MSEFPFIQRKGNDTYLSIIVAPNAKHDKVIGIHDNHLKIALAAPPRDGKANDRLIRFLAKCFGVSKSSISVEGGSTSRRKRIACHSFYPNLSGLKIGQN